MGGNPLPERQHAAALDLMARYDFLIDHGRFDELGRLFADDGTLSVRGAEHVGSTAVAAFGAQAPRGVHSQGLPVLESLDDGTVLAHSPFVYLNGRTSAPVFGWYRDTLVAEGDGFRFARREIDIRNEG